MSFDINKFSHDRKEVIFVDLELDQNDLNATPGFAVTDNGQPSESYNTPKTTKFLGAFVPSNPKKIYRFSSGSLGKAKTGDIPYFPILDSISFSTPEVKPGEKIGSSASVAIKLNDIITNDTYEMPGSTDPDFNYSVRRVTGSLLSKLFARNYLENRAVKVYRGYQNPNEEFDINNFQSEYYVLKSGKRNKSGGADIQAVDPVFLTKETKAKAPVQSDGLLQTSITDTDIQLTVLTDRPEDYTSVYFSTTPTILIDKELMEFSVFDDGTAGGTLPYSGQIILSVARTIAFPSNTTESAPHEAGTKVQVCLAFYQINVVSIIKTLITSFTKIDPSFISNPKWQDQENGALSQYNLTTVITKPTSVSKLLNELIEVSGSTFFWDVILQELTLIGITEFDSSVFTYDEDIHIVQDSLSVTPNDSDQVTRQSILFAKNSYVENDDFKNFDQAFLYIDSLSEDESAFDTVTEGKLIKSNWLTDSPNDTSIAATIPNRNVKRRSNIPKTFKFTVDPAYIGNVGGSRVWIGSVIGINSSLFTNADLSRQEVLGQITKITKRTDGFWDVTAINYSGSSVQSDFVIDQDFIALNGNTNITLTDHFTPIPGIINSVRVDAGVSIGSTSTSLNAITTGIWPDGLLLQVRGQILGTGGKGADAGSNLPPENDPICFGSIGTQNGFNGGTALFISSGTLCEIDNGGSIFSGGGGGGAFEGYTQNKSITPGKGGSGGQGFIGGLKGEGSYVEGQGNKIGPDGEDGSINGPGTVNGNGGAWGEYGQDVTSFLCGNPGNAKLSTGGTPGFSVNFNGTGSFFSSGDNSLQVKGPKAV